MKVSEAVQQMTKSYLHRVVDSFTRDFPKTDETRSREIIVKNVDDLTDPDRIKRALALGERTYSDRILRACILEQLLERPGRSAREEEIIDGVTAREQAVLDAAGSPSCLQFEAPQSVTILRAVLSVAIEDATISHEELRLISRLRRKLGLSEKAKQVLLAQLEHFPREGNRLHSPSEFRDALLDLQRRGVLFYCNRLDGGVYVIPDEVAPGLKQALGFELSTHAWRLLLSELTVTQLATMLESEGAPVSGRKEERVARVMEVGVRPSDALDALSNQDLYEVCKSLPGANVSGSKKEKVERIIDYFDNLVIKELPEEASPAERFYEYLVELAHRDRENLLANSVIGKDREMDSAFEEGTRFLFEQKLQLELMPMAGSEHADGCIEFGPGGDLLLWDTKSKEDVYRFPGSHLRQFKRYIRDSVRRVSCFLVIVPEVGDGAVDTAARLKIESKSDTDVALIAAEDLKWLGEAWGDRSSEPMNPEVFNITGALTREILEQRLRLFS